MLDFLRNLLDPLFNLMGGTLSTFHGWGASWWLAIVMLTIIVRTLLFPITYRQVKSMRRMQDLKPDMDRIRAEYKDDVQKQREEMAKLYQERQVNPLGGCLPIFYVLTMMASQELTIRNTATQQKQVMRFLPIIFGVFLARFPAGLFVYWVTSNLITFAQNYVIYYVLPHKPVDTEEDKSPTEAEKKSTPTTKQEKPAVPKDRKKSGRARNRKKKKVGKKK